MEWGQRSVFGRDEELARIDAFLTRSFAAALELEGQPGIGKTTLWLEGVERAHEHGFRVLTARPAEAEQELSFATLGDLFGDVHEQIHGLPSALGRQLAGALLLLEDTEEASVEPRGVAVAVLRTLRLLAADQPVLVAVDDIQWVDASSAMALSFALRRVGNESIAALLARRAGGGNDSRLQLEPGASVERLALGPLSLGAVRQLLETRLSGSFPRPVLRRIWDASGGNAFYALELGRALRARREPLGPDEPLPVPGDLDRLLNARLAGLPRELAEPLAAVAALAEPTREVVEEDALGPAFEAGVLVREGERVRFEHPLVATAAYTRLSPARRRVLHRRLAELVEGNEERARHLALSATGPDPALASLAEEAAVQARARGAPEAAADLAALALRLTEPDDAHARALRTVAVAEHRLAAGDVSGANSLLDVALDGENPGVDRARILVQRAKSGDGFDEAVARLREAVALAGDDAALEAEARADLTSWITNSAHMPDAEPHARRCLELAERVGDPGLLVRALQTLAWLELLCGRGFRSDLMDRALALDPLCNSLRINRRAPVVFGHMCTWIGDLERASELLDKAHKIAHDRSDLTAYALIGYTAELELLRENWQDARASVDELHDLGRESGIEAVIVLSLTARGVLFAHLGDEERARNDVAAAAALDEHHGSLFAARIGGWALALLELSLGNHEAALEAARRATLEPRAKGIEEPGLLPMFPLYAEAAIAVGAADEAYELLDWVEERAVRLDREWALACLARCRGILAAARGDESGAAAAFEHALFEHARVQGRRFDLGRTLLAQGEALRRFKKKRAARDVIEAAIEIFDELGAKLWSAKARRELARISGRARADGLTETERRVVDLAAAGRSNKQIANELFVTVRTVETHLTKAYAKLDVRSRIELMSRLSS